MNTDDRFVDIEIKLAQQEDLLETLNQTVYQQQNKIDKLEALCAALVRHIKENADVGGRNLENERPPHY